MNKKFAIFDMDGTLIDSMKFWADLGLEYLRTKGINEDIEKLPEEIEALTMSESAELFVERFSLPGDAKCVECEMNCMMDEHYRNDIPLKNGMKEYVQSLYQSGVRMCVASATAQYLIEACLERLGILGCFDFILSCESLETSKREPKIYLEAADRFGAAPEEIAVYEDALYAAETAKKAGFYVVGVYDKENDKQWEKICSIADEVLEEKENIMKTALSIAGSDSCGGAGIQADMKTMTMNGVYAMTAITALTAQNTTGVSGIMEVTPEFLGQQIDAVFEDIRPDAVKIGMVSSPALVEVIAERLCRYQAENIVVDPVMVATSGSVLSEGSAIDVMKEKLIPLATVITPNIPEAEILSGMKITSEEEMEKAAKYIGDTYHCAVLCKGGHSINDANDLLYADNKYTWFSGKRIDNPNTHGTGCTLSSAIASNLAKGFSLEESIERSKAYISGALASMLDLGNGSGPLDHMFDKEGVFR